MATAVAADGLADTLDFLLAEFRVTGAALAVGTGAIRGAGFVVAVAAQSLGEMGIAAGYAFFGSAGTAARGRHGTHFVARKA